MAKLGVVFCKHHSYGVLASHVDRLASAPHAAVFRTLSRARHGQKGANMVREGCRRKDSWSRNAIIREGQTRAPKRVYEEGLRWARRRRCLPAEGGRGWEGGEKGPPREETPPPTAPRWAP